MDDKLMCIGVDLSGKYHYIKIPELLKVYDEVLVRGLSCFLNRSVCKSTSLVLANMKARDVLHVFIDKHLNEWFSVVGRDASTVEEVVKVGCMEMFNIKEWDKTLDSMYANYNKSASIEYAINKCLSSALNSYIERLNEVEL